MHFEMFQKTPVLISDTQPVAIRGLQSLDAADALALACYHAFELRKGAVLRRAREAV